MIIYLQAICARKKVKLSFRKYKLKMARKDVEISSEKFKKFFNERARIIQNEILIEFRNINDRTPAQLRCRYFEDDSPECQE